MEKINVISRKDIENLYVNHILHALAIAKMIQFKPGTKVMDLGTGGGFPGIPLAILFPEVDFYLVDSIAKKIRVVNEIAEAIGLKNVVAEQKRVEKVKSQFDFIVTRAVAKLDQLHVWSKNKISAQNNHSFKNGLICLKGGDLSNELKKLQHKAYEYSIGDFFDEDFFLEKKIIHVLK